MTRPPHCPPGFVLRGGQRCKTPWQLHYQPTSDHRALVMSDDYRKQLATDAAARQVVLRRADEERQKRGRRNDAT